MAYLCRDCFEYIEWLPGVGWVDSRSGDDGGTYDLCPGRNIDEHIDEPHRPLRIQDDTSSTQFGGEPS